MPDHTSDLSSILQKLGNLSLDHNVSFATEAGMSHVSMQVQPSGHRVVYGPHGRRVLLTDPEGNALHECEWSESPEGTIRFVSARIFLDWNQWVGIKPSGLINTMNMDLSTKPGWQSLTRQDLRMMASRAMGVTLQEVEFFYTDDDLVIESSGQAKIQQRKDAFYVLDDKTFKQARFMSCMSAMNWENIDYLPVVELFKSLLPGTGSAAFELIRGLYDDQNPSHPKPLQYRGIPTYPSPAAFGLFSNFFTATYPGKESPFAVFMDIPRSHEVSWLPNANPPLRFIDTAQKCCVTMKQGTIQKVTVTEDSTGLPFSAPNAQGFAPCARTIAVHNKQLSLQDHKATNALMLNSNWGEISEISEPLAPQLSVAVDWRDFFPEGAPTVKAQDAFSAVLLYPEDHSMIEEHASQPFVADFLDDLFEQDDRLAQHKTNARRVFIHGFEGSLGTCLILDRPVIHTIQYSHAALAQKHAQLLWNQLAKSNHIDWLSSFQFIPTSPSKNSEKYDWHFRWIPYEEYEDNQKLHQHVQDMIKALSPGGLAFVAGPESIPSLIENLPIQILFGEQGVNLQPFHVHQSVLPKSQLNPHLHVWCLQRV